MTPRLTRRSSHERTLESLYERHAGEVYRYALVMLGSPADAEDVTQTTFLNAYRALVRGERPRATGPWLRTIAHNLCLQHFRQAARRPSEVELKQEAAELVTEDDGYSVEDLTRALGQIPVNQRAALLMRELEGRPIAEIAQVLEVSASAVETLLFRARRAVREQLEGGLTCAEAELAISQQLDGDLKRSERGKLRAHLRECEECSRLARSLRAQRGAMRSLAAIPLPGALAWSQFGPGATGGAVATSAAGLAATSGGSLAASAAGIAATGGGTLVGSVAVKLAGAAVIAGLAAGAAVSHPWTGGGGPEKAAPRHAASAVSATPARSGAQSSARTSTSAATGSARTVHPHRGASVRSRHGAVNGAHGHSSHGLASRAPAPGRHFHAPSRTVSQEASAAHARHAVQVRATAHHARPAKKAHRPKAAHHVKPVPAGKPPTTPTKTRTPAPGSGRVVHATTTPASLPSTSP